MAQPLTYALKLSNAGFTGPLATSRAQVQQFGGDVAVAGAKVGGLRTSFANAASSADSFMTKAAHVGSNLSNIVSGVEAANKVFRYFKGTTQAAATAAQAVGNGIGMAAGTVQTMGSGARVAGIGLGVFAGAAGGAAIAIGVMASAAAAAVPVVLAVSAGIAGFRAAARGVELAAELERSEVAFSAILGSGAEATAMLKELKATAKTTGDSFDSIAKAGQTLLAARVPAGSLSGELKALSTIAKVSGGDLNGIVKAYAQVAGAGRVMGDELEQFVEQGAGAIKGELAAVLGVTQSQLRDMTSEGKVGFSDLQQALQNLGGASGVWASALQASNQTTLGLLGQLKSNVTSVLTALGKPINDGPVKAVLQRLVAYSGAISAVISAAIEKGQIAAALKNAISLGVKTGMNAALATFMELPGKIAVAMAQVAKVISSAIKISLNPYATGKSIGEAIGKALLDGFTGSGWDTSKEEKFFKDLVGPGAGAKGPDVPDWAKSLDSKVDDADKASKAAGGRAEKADPNAWRDFDHRGNPRKRTSSDRFYDEDWKRQSDGRRKIFGYGYDRQNPGYAGRQGLAGFERLQLRDLVKKQDAVFGGDRTFGKFQFPLLDAMKNLGTKAVDTPGKATRREREQAARDQAQRQGMPQWDKVASIEKILKGLAVA